MAQKKLTTPQNVTTTLSTDKTKVTVKWDDTDKASDISKFTVSFLPKDGSTPPAGLSASTTDGSAKQLDFTPPKAPPSSTASTSGGAGAAPAPAPVPMPTAEELYSDYVATVVANPNANSKFDASDPGSTPYWDVDVALNIHIGGNAITLKKPATSQGSSVYRLPKGESFTISASDIEKVVGAGTLPDSLLGSTALTVSDFGIDTDNKLLKLAVSLDIGGDLKNIIPMVTIDSLSLEVERKDGVHHTLDDATATT